jgi:S1-C subfamily serine protease
MRQQPDSAPSASRANSAKSSRRSSAPKRRDVNVALLVSAALLAGLAAILPIGARSASADTRPPGGVLNDPVVRAVDVASPAVVRIVTTVSGRVALPLCGTLVTLPVSGAPYTLGWSGSGAFVSANGDILTAGHVADIDPAAEIDALYQNSRAATDIAIALNTYAACLHLNFIVTPSDVANGVVPALGISPTPTFSAPTYYSLQSTSYSGEVTTSGGSQSRLATLLAAPNLKATKTALSPFEQDDIALLHVPLSDTPSIQLGDATAVAAQDKLTIVGFPGNGDLDASLGGLDPSNLLTPSVNVVTVSAIKHNKNGSQLIQVGGNVEHGDSGGPALDAQGHIVGIVSFGGVDTPVGTSFLRSSENARTMLKNSSIDTKPGAFQTAWQQAFADYAATYAGHWRKAAEELNALSAKYPDFHAVTPYKAYAATAAENEQVNGLTQTPGLLVIGAVAGAGVLLLIIIITLVVRAQRRARQRRLAAAQVAQLQQYAPGYPYAPYAQPTVPRGGSGPYPHAYPPQYPPTYPGYPQAGSAATGVATPPPRDAPAPRE